MATTLADLISASIPLLQPLAAAATGLSRANPETVAKVNAALGAVQTGVVALGASQTAVQSQPIVDQIEAGGLAIIAAVGPMAPFPWNIVAAGAGAAFEGGIKAAKLFIQHKVTVPAVAAPVPVAA